MDFAAGLSHPVDGLDHLLAMVTVGLWAAQRGGPAVWALPAAFLAGMVAGGSVAIVSGGLAGIELGILASVTVLGGLVAFGYRPPLPAGMAVAALFALFHGYAHGAEMPAAAAPAVYGAGFLLATAVLHTFGIAAALVAGRALPARGSALVRAGGGAIAASGAVMMVL